MDLQAFHYHAVAYSSTGSAHHQLNTLQYHLLRIQAAARKPTRAKGEHHRPGSYRLVSDDVYRARNFSLQFPIEASIWYHSLYGSWRLGKIKPPSDVPGHYVVWLLDYPGPVLIDSSSWWCLQTYGRTNRSAFLSLSYIFTTEIIYLHLGQYYPRLGFYVRKASLSGIWPTKFSIL